MDEMMRQKPDRLVVIRFAGRSSFNRAGETGNDQSRIGQASRAVPIDGIHMGVDLDKSRDGMDSLPVHKGG